MSRKILITIIYLYYWVLAKTCRIKLDQGFSLEELKSNLVVVPHMCLVFASLCLEGLDFTILASSSKDGEIIAKILQWRGFRLVRGSSNRDGSKALLELAKTMRRRGAIALTPDGPKGPPLVAKPGTEALLKFHPDSKTVILLKFKFDRTKSRKIRGTIQLSTWDKMLLPLPFFKIRLEMERISLQQSQGPTIDESSLKDESGVPSTKELTLTDAITSAMRKHYLPYLILGN